MDPETTKLLITTCGAPAIIAIFASTAAAIWYIIKMRAAGIEKREDAGYSYNQAKDASLRAFGEGVKTREAEQLNEITSAALKQIYTLTDGTLTDIRNNIKSGNIEQAIQDARILSEMAAQFAVVIASLNKTIEQQARILVVLLDAVGRIPGGVNLTKDLSREVLAGLTSPAINSRPVQDAEDIATTATASQTSPPAEPGTAKIEVTGKKILDANQDEPKR